jgi:8-oxo-dGTP pyrophosphatase MutT (NUDIX family)
MSSLSPTAADPRFASLSHLLSETEGTSSPPLHDSEEGPQAAVSLILRNGRELEVLLIRRAETEGDPWSGQMALPGGRWDPEDENLLATAIRESWEETGVRLDQEGAVLGKLAWVTPNSTRLPPIFIFPFVFGVPDGTRAVVASPEVDEVLWIPLSHFSDPEASGTVEIRHGEEDVGIFPCLRVEDRVVWGLTYRILTGFLESLENHVPQLLEVRLPTAPVIPPTRQ